MLGPCNCSSLLRTQKGHLLRSDSHSLNTGETRQLDGAEYHLGVGPGISIPSVAYLGLWLSCDHPRPQSINTYSKFRSRDDRNGKRGKALDLLPQQC